EVRLDGVALRDEDVLARDGAATRVMQLTRQVAAVVLAAEQVGVAQRCLDITVDYLAQRVQFGRPLASFQALKHRCAQMMAAVELGRSAVLGAARVIDDQPDACTLLRL
ncbi:MAG TPA: acyl-CoA dehydrogenase family protein, partial [Rubrivivax sp.]|nr:acyl-CoA dehydrogenase family protein [Rubrivivax sp.]